MLQIQKDKILYAILDTAHTIPQQNDSTKWYGDTQNGIQLGRFCYDIGKSFKAHKHILRPRLSNYTQEVIIVISGKLKATIGDNDGNYFHEAILETGSMIFILTGSHKFEVLEDNTVFFEIKNGPFTSVNEDKIFLKEDELL